MPEGAGNGLLRKTGATEMPGTGRRAKIKKSQKNRCLTLCENISLFWQLNLCHTPQALEIRLAWIFLSDPPAHPV